MLALAKTRIRHLVNLLQKDVTKAEEEGEMSSIKNFQQSDPVTNFSARSKRRWHTKSKEATLSENDYYNDTDSDTNISWTIITSGECIETQNQWWYAFCFENDLLGERKETHDGADVRQTTPTIFDSNEIISSKIPIVTSFAKPIWLQGMQWTNGVKTLVLGTDDEIVSTSYDLKAKPNHWQFRIHESNNLLEKVQNIRSQHRLWRTYRDKEKRVHFLPITMDKAEWDLVHNIESTALGKGWQEWVEFVSNYSMGGLDEENLAKKMKEETLFARALQELQRHHSRDKLEQRYRGVKSLSLNRINDQKYFAQCFLITIFEIQMYTSNGSSTPASRISPATDSVSLDPDLNDLEDFIPLRLTVPSSSSAPLVAADKNNISNPANSADISIEIKNTPLEREARPRIIYPFSDTEDSENEGLSPPRRSTNSDAHTPSIPLPIQKPSNGENQQHIRWNTPEDSFGTSPVFESGGGAGSGDDGYDSDDGHTIEARVRFGGSGVDSAASTPTSSKWGSLESEKVLKNGYLRKKGEKRKTWKTRWFVLRTTKLAYYKNDKEYEILNIIPLENVTTVADVDLAHRNNVFGIVTRDRTYYLQASGPTEMESWTFFLREAQKEVQKISGGPPAIRSRVLTNEVAIAGSPPGRTEGRVQFADSVAIVASSSPPAIPRLSNFKLPSSISIKASPSNSTGITELTPALKKSSVTINRSLEQSDDVGSQISVQESVITADSSLLTYVSTPSMLLSSGANHMHSAIIPEARSVAQVTSDVAFVLGGNSALRTEIPSLNAVNSILLNPEQHLDFEEQGSEITSLDKPTFQPLQTEAPILSSTQRSSSISARSPVSHAIDSKAILTSSPNSISPNQNNAKTEPVSPLTRPIGNILADSVSGGSSSSSAPRSALRKSRGESASISTSRQISQEQHSVKFESSEISAMPGESTKVLNSLSTSTAPPVPSLPASVLKQKSYTISSSDDDDDAVIFGGSHAVNGVAGGVNEVISGVNDNMVLREGYLLKQGTKYNKAWKKRWFVLRNGKLMCYKDSAEYVVKRIIPLRSALDILEIDSHGKGHDYCFTVILPKRTLILAASSAEEMVQWIDDLRRIHHILKGDV
ncbi:hypothetical protein HK100_008991 [Physocladia obscura]|uniref:PH domain-containing protein n=1 Tax=Physocladia obscura TaxID=109957 RepID=A0AAD5XMF7_9FUNG|nr:hypothetical protein HK100_008991 [Physocladia obscura]